MAQACVAAIGLPGAGSCLEDETVVLRIVKGDQGGLGELYDLHGRAVYALASRMLVDGAEAEEVVQDVFLQVWQGAARYDCSRATVAGWLLMMTRSRAIDRIRARQARPVGSVASAPAIARLVAAGAGQESLVITREAVARLRVALGDLPQVMRAAIELAYYDGLTQTAIAERLGEPLGTIKTRMRAGLQRLRVAIAADRVSGA